MKNTVIKLSNLFYGMNLLLLVKSLIFSNYFLLVNLYFFRLRAVIFTKPIIHSLFLVPTIPFGNCLLRNIPLYVIVISLHVRLIRLHCVARILFLIVLVQLQIIITLFTRLFVHALMRFNLHIHCFLKTATFMMRLLSFIHLFFCVPRRVLLPAFKAYLGCFSQNSRCLAPSGRHRPQ